MRVLLLIAGILLFVLERYVEPFSLQSQFVFFISGIILLGIPHGAADLLVATENASGKKPFSEISFHLNYIAKLAIFALLFWLFPVAANLLFVLCAAFHFGETDLTRFTKVNLAKKVFVIFYGLLIVAVIILPHFDTLKPMFGLFDSGRKNEFFIAFLNKFRFIILYAIASLTFISFLIYLLTNRSERRGFASFVVEYTTMLFVLYHLPMILGFTFYFVLWHSIFSLKNILHYLRKDGLISMGCIAKQISFYSMISFGGFVIFGLTGLVFLNNNSLIAYVFLTLAVLTAPHMLVMHNMYKNIRFIPANEKPTNHYE